MKKLIARSTVVLFWLTAVGFILYDVFIVPYLAIQARKGTEHAVLVMMVSIGLLSSGFYLIHKVLDWAHKNM